MPDHCRQLASKSVPSPESLRPLITPILRQPHTDGQGTETRMRQAHGKLGAAKPGKPEPLRRTSYQVEPGAGRDRFRQGGEVSVVRITLAEGSRGEEHQSRAPAKAA